MIFMKWPYIICVCETKIWNSIELWKSLWRTSRLCCCGVVFLTKTRNQKLKLTQWKLFFEGQAGNEESLAHLVRPPPPEGREEKVFTMNLHFQSNMLQHSINVDWDPRSPQAGPCHYLVTLPTPSSPDHLVAMVGNIANSFRGKDI